MNAFAVTLIWCAVQVTALALLTMAVCVTACRRNSHRASATLTAAILAVLGVSGLAASPWPNWVILFKGQSLSVGTQAEPRAPASGQTPKSPRLRSDATAPTSSVGDDQSFNPDFELEEPRGWGRAFAAALLNELERTRTPDSAAARRWPGIVAISFVAGAGLMLLRFGVGLWLVGRYRRSSAPLDDPAWNRLLAELSHDMEVARPIVLRISSQASAPATIGWLCPTILLPPTYCDWSDAERRAVLAHELAHVRSGDYLVGLGAELARALHFYNPLVRWTTTRLRLEQELAADQVAAFSIGGNGPYLESLAQLAIRNDDRRVALLVRPFLPSSGTLLRRIDMLRSKGTWPTRQSPRNAKKAMLGLTVAALTLAVAGVRLSSLDGEGTAIAATQEAVATRHSDLRYVPVDAGGILIARPNELLNNPAVHEARKAAPAAEWGELDRLSVLGIRPEDIEEIIFVAPIDSGPPGLILRNSKPISEEAAVATLKRRVASLVHRGQTYFKPDGQRAFCVAFPDEKTALYAPESQLKEMIDAGKRTDELLPFTAALSQIEPNVALIVAMDSAWLTKNMGETYKGSVLLAPLSALWNRTTAIALGIDVQDNLSAKVAILCESNDATGAVTEAAAATIKVAREAIANLRRQQAQDTTAAAQARTLLLLLDPVDQLLSTARTRREDSTVYVESTAALDLAQFLTANVSVIVSVHSVKQRARCSNNLRRIAIAMHLYAERHGTLPPAVIYDEAGNPMHSWRVLLLPYLDQQELFDRYDFNEPWDGPNNRKLIDEMPDVFRCPTSDHPAGHTDYAVLVGAHTPFPPGSKAGFPLDQFRKGTSNTVLLSEISASSELEIPWTKPQDVIETEESLKPGSPKGFSSYHEGGFNAAYADGSVRLIPFDVDRDQWKKSLQAD